MGRRLFSLCPCAGPSSAQVMPSSRGGGAAAATAPAQAASGSGASGGLGLDYLNNVTPSTMEELAAEAVAATSRQETKAPTTLDIPGRRHQARKLHFSWLRRCNPFFYPGKSQMVFEWRREGSCVSGPKRVWSFFDIHRRRQEDPSFLLFYHTSSLLS